jgi:hypothetical protein
VRTFVPEGLSESSQYEVLGIKQKGMSVPQGTIETFGFWSPTRLCDCQHPSIVPSGTDSSLKTLTQHFVLGYFRQVPTGQPRTTVGRDDQVKTGLVNKVILSRKRRERRHRRERWERKTPRAKRFPVSTDQRDAI